PFQGFHWLGTGTQGCANARRARIGFTLGYDSDAPLGLWIELVCNNEGSDPTSGITLWIPGLGWFFISS
ncbi:MAG: hypothetical protein JW829_14725, partial [Pirellulales bacterium]|nr:hypothetical protein [Pirellulales bacterium]